MRIILVVEDQKIQLEIIKKGLISNGYQVEGALSAEHAFEILNDYYGRIRMILTDYEMPGMNGMDFLKRIRETNKSIPVIMMTAYGRKDLVIEAMRNRCNGFIEKPFSHEQLIDEIRICESNLPENNNSHQFLEIMPKFVHQINNPLTNIMGMAELGIIQSESGEKVRNRLENIINAARKIADMNRRLLKLEWANKQNVEAINLSEILDNCTGEFFPVMRLKNISFKKVTGNKRVHILGNAFEIEQLCRNLIQNAIDAMDGSDEKRLSIRIVTKRSASSVSLTFEDTGCGIPEKYLGKIFTPYFTTKKDGNGVGLGVVREIVENHQAKIDIKSAAGKGTTFRIEFPLLDIECGKGKNPA